MNVHILARSLNYGGTERQLVNLATGLAAAGHRISVGTFYGGGPFAPALRAAGIELRDLGKRGRWDTVGFARRLLADIRREPPEILLSYLPVSNILALLCRTVLGRGRIVWNVRVSTMRLARYDWVTALTYRGERALASWPDLIVFNSEAGRRDALANGWTARRTMVIRNGIDTTAFRRDPESRARIRREWGVAERERLIGLVARLDPMKDHVTFLQAAARAGAQDANLRFACIGAGPADYRAWLRAEAARLGLADRILWRDPNDDTPALMSALDLLTLTSAFGEGFPNVLGEAMSCGVPCVTTDVGDAGHVVGDTGAVVRPADPHGLAAAWGQMLALPEDERSRRGDAARARIVGAFGIDAMVGATERALGELIVARG